MRALPLYYLQSLKWKPKSHGHPLPQPSPKGETLICLTSFPLALSFRKHTFHSQSKTFWIDSVPSGFLSVVPPGKDLQKCQTVRFNDFPAVLEPAVATQGTAALGPECIAKQSSDLNNYKRSLALPQRNCVNL